MKKIRQKDYLSSSRDVLKAKVSAYVVSRVAAGLPGVPANPKNGGQIGMSQIGREIGVSIWDLYKILDHICALKSRHGIEDPVAGRRNNAIQALRATYASRPIPGSANGFSYQLIEVETGVPVQILRSKVCATVLAELANKNGRAQKIYEVEKEIRALAEYGDRLLLIGAALPWSHVNDAPAYSAIARGTGIPAFRLNNGALSHAMQDLIAKVPHVPGDPVEIQIERLGRFIDAAIAEGQPLPIGPKGLRYRMISLQTGIAAHLLAANRHMAAQINRWRDALPPHAITASLKTTRKISRPNMPTDGQAY